MLFDPRESTRRAWRGHRYLFSILAQRFGLRDGDQLDEFFVTGRNDSTEDRFQEIDEAKYQLECAMIAARAASHSEEIGETIAWPEPLPGGPSAMFVAHAIQLELLGLDVDDESNEALADPLPSAPRSIAPTAALADVPILIAAPAAPPSPMRAERGGHMPEVPVLV